MSSVSGVCRHFALESGVRLNNSSVWQTKQSQKVACFTPGTRILTPHGEKLVQDLVIGDRIVTRDNGVQKIAWTGSKSFSGADLAMASHLQPILIKAGALGSGVPEHDMMVSPNHRMLVCSHLTQLYFEDDEVLAAAKHMVGVEGIMQIDVIRMTYIHFMFERHEVIMANGAWTESFHANDYTLQAVGNSQRNEIFELFPDLATTQGRKNYEAVRRVLKKRETTKLIH